MSDNLERIYGRNPVLEVFRAERRRVLKLLLARGVKERGSIAQILEFARAEGIPRERVDRRELDKESRGHQGVVAVVESYPYARLKDILARSESSGDPPLVLLLDTLQDPQNFGTLLRTAEAVGVHGVVVPLRRMVGVTPAVVSASAGASEHLLVSASNLVGAIRALQALDAWVLGLERGPEALPLAEIDLTLGLGLVVGSEGKGMRRLVRQSCDYLGQLPMRGRVGSLNAAVAGSIALYAIWHARGYPGGR